MDEGAAHPREIWPDLSEWTAVGMNEEVFRVRTAAGDEAYVRPDDGSSDLLERLASNAQVAAPRVLGRVQGWLLLTAIPGISLHERIWIERPMEAAAIAADALRRLAEADVTHGDMCLPNILGDPATGLLAGIIDWRYAGQFGREIDVASAVWSCEYNGYGSEVAPEILRRINWPQADAAEVKRLSKVWLDLAGDPADL